jgi:hypothetical protein
VEGGSQSRTDLIGRGQGEIAACNEANERWHGRQAIHRTASKARRTSKRRGWRIAGRVRNAAKGSDECPGRILAIKETGAVSK